MSVSALVAIGRTSLIRAGERGTVTEQLANAKRICSAIVPLVRTDARLVVSHGNGPQVGAALLRSERASGRVYEHPPDVCVTSTQGELGYLLQQALQQVIRHMRLSAAVGAILTQVVVSAEDPSFRPSAPIW